ncbi:hypothetical protein [Ekhidna sp.]
MTYSIHFKKLLPIVPFIIPILCIVVASSSLFVENTVQLSMAMTFDLLITTPVIYFLIIRKRAIPKTTIVPVFILGIVTASVILPIEHQYHLSLVKKWFLPLLEVSIVTYVIFTIRKAYKSIKKNGSKGLDFFTAAKDATSNILPKRLVSPFATELSVFYYGFIAWKKRILSENEYSYHKTTSTSMLLGVFVFLILIEAFAVHLLLQEWSTLAAWILTVLSAYGIFQIIGIARSLAKRPIVLQDDQLILRYGIMGETAIPYELIETVSEFKKSVEKNEGYVHLSPFKDMEGHNTLIEVREDVQFFGFYGFKKTFSKLLIYVDEPEGFRAAIEERIIPSEQSTS